VLKVRLILAATVLATASASFADARAPAGKCRSPKGTVLAINRQVVVYKVGRPDTTPGVDALSGPLIACRRASGNKVQLSGSTLGEHWYDRPARAVKVRDSTVAWAAELDDFTFGTSSESNVLFLDMRRPHAWAGVTAGGLIGSVDFEIAPASPGLDLTARRAAAWIECPDLDEVSNADPRPNCVRPGLSVNWVYAVARGSSTPVLLGQGRTIDPLSVRIRDGQVSWIQTGRRRTAAAPVS